MAKVLRGKGYEDYLISNMRRYKEKWPLRSKSWINTTRSLFPNDFRIQFETYRIEKNWSNAKESSAHFAELVKKFPNESEVSKEISNVVDALKDTRVKSEQGVFLKKMFKHLPADVKSHILSNAAVKCTDPVMRCRIMTLLIEEIPDELHKNCQKVVNSLSVDESIAHGNHPVNLYRKILVCKVMPVVIASDIKLPQKLLMHLLQASMEFYLSLIFTMPDKKFDSSVLKACRDDDAILAAADMNDAWKSMFLVIKAVGKQLNWSLTDLFSSKLCLILDMNWKKTLLVARDRLFPQGDGHSSMKTQENIHHEKETFFTVATIFFYALYQFSNIVHPKSAGSNHYLLVQGMSSTDDESSSESIRKKFKYDKIVKSKADKSSLIVINHSCWKAGENLKRSFMMAAELWKWMQQVDCLRKNVTQLCQIVKMSDWPCFKEFYTNLLVYWGHHIDAVAHLKPILKSADDPFTEQKTQLQLACCLSHVCELFHAWEYLIAAFSALASSGADCSILPSKQFKPHQFCFISYNLRDVLNLTVSFLLCAYKKNTDLADHRDVILGHLVILSQYQWPREKELLMQCLEQIKKTGSFFFDKFFKYVINSFVLEEFMHMISSNQSIILDILPRSMVQQERPITRGMNRCSKEDLKEAIINQMVRSNESVERLLVTFISEEQDHIHQIMSLV